MRILVGDTVLLGEKCDDVRLGEVIATDGEYRIVHWRDGEITRQKRGSIETLKDYETMKRANGTNLAFLGHMYEMFWKETL